MHRDRLAAGATAGGFPNQASRVEQMHVFRGHSGRGWTRDKQFHRRRLVSRFFQKFAAGGFHDGFPSKFFLVANKPGRNFNDRLLNWNSKLFHQNDLTILGDGQDAHARIGIRPANEIPVPDSVESQPAGFEKCLGSDHCEDNGQETLALRRNWRYFFRAQMSRHDFDIPVTFKHRIVFTRDAFSLENRALAEILEEGGGRKVMVFIEQTVATIWPQLEHQIRIYLAEQGLDFRGVFNLPGGEGAKADDLLVNEVWAAIDDSHLDRHSYALVIGGGAFLDAIGFAAATAHRGVRLIRFPTTTLSQDDSGVGVKCAINAFGKKNWIGAFSVPFAVINDFDFLRTQDEDTGRAGLVEAVKVALVRDRKFFLWIEQNLENLADLHPATLEKCVEKSALLHASHIATGGDPFETGSSRPLDFGHWAAHKLESMSSYQLFHAPAVGVGVALDTLYSARSGLMKFATADRILKVLDALQIKTYHPALDWIDDTGRRRVLDGLDEFREHLGGELTVLLLRDLGTGVDVHQIDEILLGECINELKTRWESRG